MAEERIEALERKLEAMEDGVAKCMRITEEQKEGFSDAVQRGMSLLKAELGMTINDARGEFTKIREEIVNVWGQAVRPYRSYGEGSSIWRRDVQEKVEVCTGPIKEVVKEDIYQ